ncbi:uncharacterized protein J4E79_001278 [Alternaria viburni]|uniref:uncharacterized protein n=1 Tax=Alternaria viburni TaxID=566460 RepID=UPI0020C4D243|nr:uncharacterized protein J4E79_001278 [Alternaria viburni]KAI4669235.1 hypothetical protein J4E79_001278 [Alternaria viburni]
MFIDRILARPDIAEKYVRKIKLGFWDSKFAGPRPEIISEELYDAYTKAAKAANVIDIIVPYEAAEVTSKGALVSNWRERDWYTELLMKKSQGAGWPPYDLMFCQVLRAGHEDALVALVLALLPNLRVLELHTVLMNPDQIILPWRLPKHGFKKLVRLTAANDRAIPWSASFLNQIMDNTSLQTLELARGSCWYQAGGDLLESPPIALPLGLGALTALHLPNCAFTCVEMQKLLSASPRLKRLYFSYGLAMGPYNFTAGELITMLDSFKNTLEDLYLDIVPSWMTPQEEDSDSSHLIESLRHFTALRRLDTNVDVWRMLDVGAILHKYQPGMNMNYECKILEQDRWCWRLPPVLEFLSLHPTHRETTPDSHQLRDLVSSQRQALPELKALVIAIHDEGFRDLMKMEFYSYMEDYQATMENETDMGAPSGTDDESYMDSESDTDDRSSMDNQSSDSVDQPGVGNQFGSDDQPGMVAQSNSNDQSNMSDWSSVNGLDEDDRINIKVGSAAEASGPIKTTFHGWRPSSEMPRIHWEGHAYVLKPGERPCSEADNSQPRIDRWLRELTGVSTYLASEGDPDLVYSSSSEEDFGHGYMLDAEWEDLVETL